MSISVKTRKILWGKSANRCAIPNCRRELVMDEIETDDPSIVGEECHIIAKKDDGPRGNPNFPEEQRDLYANLILMCNIHHKVIDDQEQFYSVAKLKEIKRDHEEWVNNSLNIDEIKMREELIYSDYIDEWVRRVDLDTWDIWTSWLLGSGQPQLNKQKLNELEELKNWIFTRIMPNTYIELENSFENFRRVLQDLINTFTHHSIERNGELYTEKFYKLDRWDPELNSKLHKEYMFHVDLIMDLTTELTRAANLICDQIRRYILSDFRLEEGILVITSGPYMDFSLRTHKVRYAGDQRTGIPYKDLSTFKKERIDRDFSFGAGSDVGEAIELGIEY
ncbi:hypothetical protein JSQ81_12960 [Sporosarcina sp. Marseille-Q4063]|uniref:hypothetical protein n=1 Tax=Sporosarcina sp. Marseille-Q4063 TaxID=2810514 RepID=UPI001BB0879F|nr:hypothetical protein [Sporosarcina sp. Marseille-Q4063]QUW20727.1 hypothetical protein JSQ81_12960 [Sporosarcina sp. Marseille-Q4063]